MEILYVDQWIKYFKVGGNCPLPPSFFVLISFIFHLLVEMEKQVCPPPLKKRCYVDVVGSIWMVTHALIPFKGTVKSLFIGIEAAIHVPFGVKISAISMHPLAGLNTLILSIFKGSFSKIVDISVLKIKKFYIAILRHLLLDYINQSMTYV